MTYFGISATPVDSKYIINVTREKLTIRHHTLDNVGLQVFISNLITIDIRAREHYIQEIAIMVLPLIAFLQR
jgi:hypothetical protein